MTTPNVSLPPGFNMVETSPGVWQVIPTGERLTKTVAFRLTPSEYLSMLPFFEVFPDGQQSLALRWLMTQPEVQELISARVALGSLHAATST